jgi:hypothetical protein
VWGAEAVGMAALQFRTMDRFLADLSRLELVR